ncbi:MAG TPA: tetratricopeptide repeat protein [Actinoplanes sp.]|nr:tetratricopeptide repeat protein [Actinoplanes sp.]
MNGDGVVIDLDITGLFHGYGVTAEQALIVPRESPDGDTSAGRPASPGGDTAPNQSEQARATESDQERVGSAPTEVAEGPTDLAEAPTDLAETVADLTEGPTDLAEAPTDLAEAVAEVAEPVAEVAEAVPTLSAADLEAIRWRLDGGTLREVVDDPGALRDLGGRLDEPLAEERDNVARAGLLSVRAEVYRLLGELGLAAAASRLALAHAEAAGDVQATVIAQAELAHVLRLRGDFAEADRLFEVAASSEAPEVLRSVVHENAGRCCFDQGRLMEALDHFARAIRLGAPDDLDLVERIGVSLEAVYIHVLRDGWGPYPRLRSEILRSSPQG